MVSAAAGSGKTTVLVARVLKKLISSENSVTLDELLLITFSNAAAEQMKAKIIQKLKELMNQMPEKKVKIQLQLDSIGFANCSTFHSFCLKIVKENAILLGFGPEINIASESEIIQLKRLAFEKTMEHFYALKNWSYLADLCEFYHDDEKLFKNLLKFYEFSRSKPFYKDFWKDILNYYNRSTPNIKDDKLLKLIFEISESVLKFCCNCVKNNIEVAQKYSLKEHELIFMDDLNLLNELIATLRNSNSSTLVKQYIYGVKLKNLPNLKDNDIDMLTKNQIICTRKIIRKHLDTLKDKIFCYNEENVIEDRQYSFKYFSLLLEIISLFDKEFLKLKRNKNLIDYSDIEHFTLNLLYDKDKNNNLTKTQIAKEISNRFSEILIDEFQDINEVQDLIINAISKEYSNVFMVGDVKQSIYRFRHAVPEIFLEKKNSLPDYDGKTFPAKIFLKNNFRSTKSLIDSINFIFSQLMSVSTAGINYDSTQELVSNKQNGPDETAFKIGIIETEQNVQNAINLEAKYIAEQIKQKMKSNFKILEKGIERPISYGDFCILLRSTKDRIEIYKKVLIEAGIPVIAQSNNNFWQNPEILVLISILKAVNNPMDDISITATMCSPLFSFSLNKVMKIRLINETERLYNNIASCNDIDCKNFVGTLKEFANFSASNSLYEFVNYIYTEKKYLAFSAIRSSHPDSLRNNLYIFLDLVKHAEALKINSLHEFINYIEQQRKTDISPDSDIEEEIFETDAVKIMSIHKSKGLEFPICFLANSGKSFNRDDIKNRLLFHRKLGAACVKYSGNKMFQTSTIFRSIIMVELQQEALAEELRLLYVALTRAKYQIVIPVITKNFKEKISELFVIQNISSNYGISANALQDHQNYADIIILALLAHPAFCRQFDIINSKCKNTDSKFEIEVISSLSFKSSEFTGKFKSSAYKVFESQKKTENFEKTLNDISKNLEFEYPYKKIASLPSQISVSELLSSNNKTKKFSLKPKFLNNLEMPISAERIGSIMHRFMQFCDYKAAAENFEKELQFLADTGRLSPQELEYIPKSNLKHFFNSTFYLNIVQHASKIMREVKFSANFKSSLLFNELGCFDNELINLHGIADCVLEFKNEIFLLDFKSDKVQNLDLLVQKYKYQLYIYKSALELNFLKPITRLFIYSWFKNKEIEVYFDKKNINLTPFTASS